MTKWWQYKVYAGKEAQPGTSVSSKVVMELMEPYLDFGRTLYADNWYNSITLAEQLLDRETFLVGTLSANRKRNPTDNNNIATDVTKKKLKKGEIVARHNDNGIMVVKWKDRRDVLAIKRATDEPVVENYAPEGPNPIPTTFREFLVAQKYKLGPDDRTFHRLINLALTGSRPELIRHIDEWLASLPHKGNNNSRARTHTRANNNIKHYGQTNTGRGERASAYKKAQDLYRKDRARLADVILSGRPPLR
ncbi:hypothetical protein NQ318_007498 [Aromia moschata]|uniref:PiggyBac transposable element-derived protein domain-containing protein n=1 Tax=Aromia moschata TaxID=1265417 RepID=A0AAV8YDW2_9CUCU|nr:hypothetical protein NQ318_007498 [Aromia moschata]